MAIPLEVLAAEVLGLPHEERSQLLDQLVVSLEQTPFDPEWEQAWAAELDRREAEIKAGTARWVPGEEVMARLRARLA